MRHARARLGKDAQLVVVEVDAVRKPDVGAHPANGLHVRERSHARGLDGKALLVERLAQVRVQAHAQRAAQLGRLNQQVLGHGERRAGCQHHLPHREGRRVVELLYRALGVGENGIHALDHRVWW